MIIRCRSLPNWNAVLGSSDALWPFSCGILAATNSLTVYLGHVAVGHWLNATLRVHFPATLFGGVLLSASSNGSCGWAGKVRSRSISPNQSRRLPLPLASPRVHFPVWSATVYSCLLPVTVVVVGLVRNTTRWVYQRSNKMAVAPGVGHPSELFIPEKLNWACDVSSGSVHCLLFPFLGFNCYRRLVSAFSPCEVTWFIVDTHSRLHVVLSSVSPEALHSSMVLFSWVRALGGHNCQVRFRMEGVVEWLSGEGSGTNRLGVSSFSLASFCTPPPYCITPSYSQTGSAYNTSSDPLTIITILLICKISCPNISTSTSSWVACTKLF